MSAPIKRVTRFTSWVDAAFDEGVRRETDIDLRVLAVPASAEAAWAALADTHVFHVSAAKDELPKYCHVGEALLSHCPQLLCASSYGAGYDPIDVPACTRAGVAVVNQAGGNAVSVAELALGLILSVARRITESDRRLRTDRVHPLAAASVAPLVKVTRPGETPASRPTAARARSIAARSSASVLRMASRPSAAAARTVVPRPLAVAVARTATCSGRYCSMVSSTLRLAQNAPLAPTATPVLNQKTRLNTPTPSASGEQRGRRRCGWRPS